MKKESSNNTDYLSLLSYIPKHVYTSCNVGSNIQILIIGLKGKKHNGGDQLSMAAIPIAPQPYSQGYNDYSSSYGSPSYSAAPASYDYPQQSYNPIAPSTYGVPTSGGYENSEYTSGYSDPAIIAPQMPVTLVTLPETNELQGKKQGFHMPSFSEMAAAPFKFMDKHKKKNGVQSTSAGVQSPSALMFPISSQGSSIPFNLLPSSPMTAQAFPSPMSSSQSSYGDTSYSAQAQQPYYQPEAQEQYSAIGYESPPPYSPAADPYSVPQGSYSQYAPEPQKQTYDAPTVDQYSSVQSY